MSARERLNCFIERQHAPLSGRTRAAPCPLGMFDVLPPPPYDLSKTKEVLSGEVQRDAQPESLAAHDSEQPRQEERQEEHTISAFPLMALPPEIRAQIWVMALPNRRVFHVSRTVPNPLSSDGSHHLLIHNPRPKPPAMTQVCVEARDAARRSGGFHLFQPDGPGIFFNPNKDIVFFDRDNRSPFARARTRQYQGSRTSKLHLVHGLDRVQHVGIEWRWFLQHGTVPLEQYSGDRMSAHWATVIAAIREYMPRMGVIHYMLPMVRHKGGYAWGREPLEVKKLGIEIVPLPGETVIPIDSGHQPWSRVHQEFEKAFKRLEDPPSMVGWRLLRMGAPSYFGDPSVSVFNY